jgi:hypothetical protein
MKTSPKTSHQKPLWGTAHRMRGLPSHEHAVAFSQRWPNRPMLITVEDFDRFAAERGVYQIPSTHMISSPARRSMILHRSKFKEALNRAGSHTRMITASGNVSPFVISVVVRGRTWEIRSPDDAYKDLSILESMQHVFEPFKRNIEYCLQSVQWEHLPPYEPRFAEQYYKRLVSTQSRLQAEYIDLQQEFHQLEEGLRRAVLPAPGELGA